MSKVSKIANLTPFSRGVNVLAKVIEKTPERTVLSKFDRTEHRIVEATIADETGAITLVLWDDNIDKINEGDTIELENAFVKVFKRSMPNHKDYKFRIDLNLCRRDCDGRRQEGRETRFNYFY